jgi:putative spermidine/putrescine transport system substrate-binding protein
MISRRSILRAGTGLAAVTTLGAPSILHAQASTLKITTWGGKWGDIMKATVLPAFEKEFKCTVSADQAFPYVPKLQASSKNDPLYDVLQTNSNEQWNCFTEGLVMDKVSVKDAPNIADVYPYAVSDKIVGVTIFTSAIGLGYRTDKGITPPKSWKDLADPKLAGARGSYLIPVNSLGQCHLMMLGKIYGKGLQDLDAAYKALELLKPIKLVDFTGQMEKMLLSAEVNEGVIHDSGVYRYEGENRQPVDFCSPTEGVVALEQVLSVTPGSKVKQLAYAYIDYMLRPDVQKLLAEAVWYSPANKKVKLSEKYDAKLLTTPEKVATLIQPDWKWYNARKEDIDGRVTKILKS